MGCLVISDFDLQDNGLRSPLHSIFDFDGSDTTNSSGLVATPLHAFLFSFTMIIISELGDKTFLIAALMAMRHSRAVVFSAAFASLFVMTVLSAALGHAVPHLSISVFIHSLMCSTTEIHGIFGSRLIPRIRRKNA
jgi:hypothetical protein